MYESYFTYRVSRPYPFRWFTPVAIIGGIAFTVLFSTINLAANGYILKTIYTPDPNSTVNKHYWYNSAPWSWSSKLKPSCEAQDIAVGAEFFTTHLGLSYTLTDITQDDKRGIQHLPSVSYLNNTLTNCQVDSVEIQLRRSDQSITPHTQWWSWDDSSALATAHCVVQTGTNPVNISFSTTYKADADQFDYIINNSTNVTSSLWWGSRLANMYWNGILVTMSQFNYTYNTDPDDGVPFKWDKANMIFTPGAMNSITKTDFFDVNYYFLASDAAIYNSNDTLVSKIYNTDNNYGGTINEGDGFSKAMYSLILIDLGQNDTRSYLLQPDTLQYALTAPDDDVRMGDGILNDTTRFDSDDFAKILAPNGTKIFANSSYALLKDQLGPLRTSPSTIYTQYVCSVPEKKDSASLFISILVADLVFLQALWTLFSLFCAWLAERKYPTVNYCRGCDGMATAAHTAIHQPISFNKRDSDDEVIPLVHMVPSESGRK